MENDTNSNKKLIIICITIILVVAMVMAVVIIMVKNKSKDNTMSIDGMEMLLNEQISYEEFIFGIKDDVTDEEEAALKELYAELNEAISNDDNDAVMEVYAKLSRLDIYDDSIIKGIMELSPEDFANLDPNGSGVVYFGEGELPDGFEIIGESDNE